MARENRRNEAETLFGEVLEAEPNNETALIWKAAVTEDQSEAVRCLERVLAVNPDNKRAQAGLEWAHRRLNARVKSFSATDEEEAPRVVVGKRPLPDNVIPFRSVERPLEQPTESTTSPSVNREVSSKPSIVDTPDRNNSEIAEDVPSFTVETETSTAIPPYKKSRLQPKGGTMDARPGSKEARSGLFGKKKARRATEFSLKDVPFTVSEKINQRKDWQAAGKPYYEERSRVNLALPIILFLLALLLAIATFPLVNLAPVLGIAAFLITLAGVWFFNQAEF